MLFTEDKLKTVKVKNVQIDFFGFCNAGCWFCPVKYYDLPKKTMTHMPLDMVEKIFANIASEIGNLLKSDEEGLVIWTHSYSEVLLYKHLKGLFELARKYKLKLLVLSNGTTLTPDKAAILRQYPDVLKALILNVPAFEADIWSEYTSLPVKKFDTLMNNLQNVSKEFSYLNKGLKFMINGIGDDAHKAQVENAKRLFPHFDLIITEVYNRSGKLEDIIDGPSHEKVIGCGDNFVDRILESIHINAIGEYFICCNDYDYEYVFGNVNDSSFSEIWGSEEHIKTIHRSLNNFCKKCNFAIPESQTGQ